MQVAGASTDGLTEMAAHSALLALRRVDGYGSLLEAAGELARARVPVFPCAPNGKNPLTIRGFHDATTDLRQIDRWWRSAPQANIGVPTGTPSGMVVVDVDRHGMADGYEAFAHAERAGLVLSWEVLVRSPSGGMHAYFLATPDAEQRSWQLARAGVDFRGDGGYIIVPPSSRMIDTQRQPYTVQSVNCGPAQTLDSERLRDFLDPRPTPAPQANTGAERSADASRLASWVARCQEGERNAGLFWAACRLAENGTPPSEALDVLSTAAGHTGLREREIATTIRSAYRTVHASGSRTTAARNNTRAPASGPQRSPMSSSPVVREL